MGLFVVSRLAKRHGLTVRLRSTFDTARNPGVTVSIHIPNALIVSQAARQDTGPQRKIPAAPVRTAIPAPAAPAPRKDNGQQPATRNGLPTRTPSTPPPAPSPAPAGAVTTASGTSLPRRQPGASGIAAGAGSSAGAPAAQSQDTVNVRGSGAMPKLPVRRPQATTPETAPAQSQATTRRRHRRNRSRSTHRTHRTHPAARTASRRGPRSSRRPRRRTATTRHRCDTATAPTRRRPRRSSSRGSIRHRPRPHRAPAAAPRSSPTWCPTG